MRLSNLLLTPAPGHKTIQAQLGRPLLTAYDYLAITKTGNTIKRLATDWTKRGNLFSIGLPSRPTKASDSRYPVPAQFFFFDSGLTDWLAVGHARLLAGNVQCLDHSTTTATQRQTDCQIKKAACIWALCRTRSSRCFFDAVSTGREPALASTRAAAFQIGSSIITSQVAFTLFGPHGGGEMSPAEAQVNIVLLRYRSRQGMSHGLSRDDNAVIVRHYKRTRPA